MPLDDYESRREDLRAYRLEQTRRSSDALRRGIVTGDYSGADYLLEVPPETDPAWDEAPEPPETHEEARDPDLARFRVESYRVCLEAALLTATTLPAGLEAHLRIMAAGITPDARDGGFWSLQHISTQLDAVEADPTPPPDPGARARELAALRDILARLQAALLACRAGA
jgi:hypothetical protein